MINDACAFSPKPSPTATPFAIAITFLTDPPSSVPTTSGLVYGRKYGVRQACWTRRAVSASVHATTVAAGCRCMISRARFGPDTTATRLSGTRATSATTSLMRRMVPSSMPFMRLTSTASGGSSSRQPASAARSACAGTASTTRSAPDSAAAGSAVACTLSGSRIPGWYPEFSRLDSIVAARPGSFPQSATCPPASASTMPNAVPQEPLPITADRVTTGAPRPAQVRAPRAGGPAGAGAGRGGRPRGRRRWWPAPRAGGPAWSAERARPAARRPGR